MPKVYIASEARRVQAERTCANCSHKWTASFDIRGSSMAQSTSQKAAREARAMVAAERDEKLRNCDVVCPECNHFSEDAMHRHFKNGYLEGILKKYKSVVWTNLGTCLLAAWIPILLALFANLNPFNASYPVRSVLWLLLFVWFGGITVSNLLAFVWGLSALSSVRQKLGKLSDDQIRELAITCYRANKNSLKADFDVYRWNAWFRKPLFYRPASALVSEQAMQ